MNQILEYLGVLGAGLIIVEVIRSIVQRRKMGADAAKTITEAATSLLAPLQERVRELEPLEDRVNELISESRATKALLARVSRRLEDTEAQLEFSREEVRMLKERVKVAEQRATAAEEALAILGADTSGDQGKGGSL